MAKSKAEKDKEKEEKNKQRLKSAGILAVLIAFVGVLAAFSGPNEGSQSASQNRQREPITQISEPASASVVDRGLVATNPNVTSIVAFHHSYHANVANKNYDGMSLGYVTPWNKHGYETSKLFHNKFTHISPVWFTVKMDASKQDAVISGGSEIDKKWLNEIKSQSSSVKIVPRFNFEFSAENYEILASSQPLRKKIASAIKKECKKYKLDGIVLEMAHSWAMLENKNKNSKGSIGLNVFVKKVARMLHASSLSLILVIPPPFTIGFNAEDFANLHSHVEAFSLMSYDFSSSKPGPSAPLAWVESCIKFYLSRISTDDAAKKLLVGLNFYGVRFGPAPAQPAPIVGQEYIKYLDEARPRLTWDRQSHEHHFSFVALNQQGEKETHHVFYPTLMSIQDRLKLAASFKCGVAVWELGQGLDYFFDLL